METEILKQLENSLVFFTVKAKSTGLFFMLQQPTTAPIYCLGKTLFSLD